MADVNGIDIDDVQELGSLASGEDSAMNGFDGEVDSYTFFSGAATDADSTHAGTFVSDTLFSADLQMGNAANTGAFLTFGHPTPPNQFGRVDHRAEAIGRIVLQLRRGYDPQATEFLPGDGSQILTGEGDASTSYGTFA